MRECQHSGIRQAGGELKERTRSRGPVPYWRSGWRIHAKGMRGFHRSVWMLLGHQTSLVAQTEKNLPTMQETTLFNADSIPGLGRSPGVGNGNPLQFSCLENSMGRGAWWATVYGQQRVGHNWATDTDRRQKTERDGSLLTLACLLVWVPYSQSVGMLKKQENIFYTSQPVSLTFLVVTGYLTLRDPIVCLAKFLRLNIWNVSCLLFGLFVVCTNNSTENTVAAK